MPIVALDKNTVKQITTAQVINSVQSAVKELIENALDAEAKSIEVYLEDKGLASIEVRDNGKGISKVDSTYMALPSYTSKISNVSDLESLESYGFRGEALNALCRVSDVKVITRTCEDDNARCYTLSYEGVIDKAEFCSRAIGTTVHARSLFKNIPVRRQIISTRKHANQDVKSIENLLQGFAVCRPELRITYRVDNSTVFSKIPATSHEENLVNIFGRKFASQYDSLDSTDLNVAIKLTIPKKDLDDLSDVNQVNYQYIFVNNRPVTMKEFDKTVVKYLSIHFGEKISGRKKPVFFLLIEVPPNAVDVNLEANKTSVLLVNQSSIITMLSDLLINYYGITLEEQEESLLAIPSSSTHLDSSYASIEPPSAKKRRIEEPCFTSDSESITNNKENVISINDLQLETSSTIKSEPVDQIPKNIINSLTRLNAQRVEESPAQITGSQWSKGHVSVNLPGSTDVTFVGIHKDVPLPIKTNTSANPQANKNGFFKFSKEMTPKLMRENPQMNLVEIAKLLSNEWKQLEPQCRENYRQLGLQDKSFSHTKAAPISSARKTPKSLVKDYTANKKRLLNMFGNMKDQKIEDTERTPKASPPKTFIPWEISMQSLVQRFRNKNYQRRGHSLIVGPINERIWISRTNMELWCLDVDQLLKGLGVEDNNSKKIPEDVENYLQRWLIEKDSMDIMQSLYQLDTIKRF